MKKFSLLLLFALGLTACGTSGTIKTVVVDQNGKVIEEKVEGNDRFNEIYELPTSWDEVALSIFQDKETGCKYLFFNHQTMTPLYDANGNVDGCKNIIIKDGAKK